MITVYLDTILFIVVEPIDVKINKKKWFRRKSKSSQKLSNLSSTPERSNSQKSGTVRIHQISIVI